MSEVIEDPAFRVHKVRLWCEPRREYGDDDVVAMAAERFGYLCGFQLLYKHETTGQVVRGSVTGDTDKHGLKVAELLLFAGEHVSSIKCVEGVLEICTNFCRGLRCLIHGNVVDSNYVAGSDCEIRALFGEGSRNHWTLWIQDGVRSTSDTLSQAAVVRYRDIKNAWKTFVERKPSIEVANVCNPTLARLFALHGELTAIETRKLVATGSIAPRLSAASGLFASYAHKMTRTRIWPLARTSSSDEIEAKVTELEREVNDLLYQETTTGFDGALQENNVAGIRSAIQSRIEANKLDEAARLCFQAFTTEDPKVQIAEIVFEARGIRHENYFAHAQQASSIAEALRIVPDLRFDGRTALHVAAECHLFNLVELLLVHCRMDPLVRDNSEHKLPLDLVGPLTDTESNNEEVHRVLLLLDRCGRAKEFRLRTTGLLKSGVVTQGALDELLPCITAVQDLQVVIGLGATSLELSAFRQLLNRAFEHVIMRKLVFGNDAAAYFTCGLEQCFSRGYLTKFELEHWKIQTTQVNMENASWVTEIKAALQKIQYRVVTLETNTRILKTHFESLRQALVDKEQQEQQRAYRQKMVSLLTLGLSWVCGSIVEVIIDGVMDLTDPVHLLSATLELLGPDAIAEFCASDDVQAVFRDGIKEILARSDIEPFDFADVLRDAVILEHPEYAPNKKLRNRVGASTIGSPLSVNQRVRSARVSSSESDRSRSSSRGRMSGVACDSALRVHKIRLWCEFQGVNDEANGGFGYLCGFQFLYQHETTGAVVRGPVTGEADAPWQTQAELLLFTGEHVNSVRIADGFLEIGTNFCRGLSCMLRGELVGAHDMVAHNSEIRALYAEGNRAHWTISIHEVVRSTSVSLPTAVIARYLNIEDACYRLRARVASLTSEPWVEQWFYDPSSDRIDARLFQIHGLMTSFEARQLVATRAVEAELGKTVDLVNQCTQYLMNATILPEVTANLVDSVERKLAELERLTQDLYAQEETREFSNALDQGNASIVQAVIQSRIDANLHAKAARLCVRAIGAVDVKDQVIELIFEIFKVRDEAAFINAREKSSIAEALANMPGYPKGYSALHLAAAQHAFQVMEPLLVDCQLDPTARECYKNKRPSDLVGPLRDHEAECDEVHRVLFLLDQCTNAREFRQRAVAVLNSGSATRSTLEELFPFMTAIQDLQVIITLGASSLEASEFQQLPKAAFQYVINSKLLFENEAVEYFQTGLEQCFAKGYITKPEFRDWGLAASQLNVHIAQWVPETTRTVQAMKPQASFLEKSAQILKAQINKLRLELILNKDQQQKQKLHCQKLLPSVALALRWVGGPVLTERLNGVMDLVDPLRLMTATLDLADMDMVVRLCVVNGMKAAFRPGVEAILERSSIQPSKFVALLKEAVVLECPGLLAGDDKVRQLINRFEEKLLAIAVRVQQPPETSASPRKESSSRGAERNEPERQQSQEEGECGFTAQDFATQHLEAFPYHYAIRESSGSLEKFLALLELGEQDGYDINQAYDIIVRLDPAISSSSASRYKRLTLPPYVFASYFGYVDIVKHLRARSDFKTWAGGELLVVTMNRALKAATALQVA